MAANTHNGLHYGVGRWSTGSIALLALSLVFVGMGIYAYSLQAVHGEIVTGLRNIGIMGGATWGLYVAFVIYFMGVSFAGITIAVLTRLFNLESLKPITRMAEIMTIIALMLGALAILADVGKPLRAILYLPLYGRPMSPFFGTFAIVISGYLFASVVYFYLDGRRDAALCAKQTNGTLRRFFRFMAAGYQNTEPERKRHEQVSFWLSLAILPLLVVATSTLGAVFGLQVGRPGWHSGLQAPGFVILAGVSGIGHLIILAALFRAFAAEKEKININLFKWLGNILMVLTFAYIYFLVVEWLSVSYASTPKEEIISSALTTGKYAPIFWVSITSLVASAAILLGQYVTGGYRIGLMVLSGILVNIAAIGKRFLIVVPSQTHGTLLPYGTGSYTPSMVELGVILGLLGLGALLYIVFVKVFPIMEVPQTAKGDS